MSDAKAQKGHSVRGIFRLTPLKIQSSNWSKFKSASPKGLHWSTLASSTSVSPKCEFMIFMFVDMDPSCAGEGMGSNVPYLNTRIHNGSSKPPSHQNVYIHLPYTIISCLTLGEASHLGGYCASLLWLPLVGWKIVARTNHTKKW